MARKHYTNGVENVFCEICPEGYHPGMTLHHSRTTSSRKTDKFLQTLDKQEFEKHYRTQPTELCAEYFSTTEFIIEQTAKKLNLKRTEEEKANIRKITLKKKKLKTETTCLNKYGVKSPAQSEELQQSWKEKFQEKYGINKGGRAISALKSNTTDEFKQLQFSETLSKEFFNQHNKEFTKQDLMNRFNCPEHVLNNWLYGFRLHSFVKATISKYEQEILNLFPSVKFVTHCRKLLTNKEIDLYAPDFKLGIEFNGDYWHSSINLPKSYHLTKSREAEEKGIRLIHIYEYEWTDPVKRDKIIQLLNISFNINVTKIYARNCEIKEITNKEAKELNDLVHLQSHRNAQVTLGLFHKNKLVQLMSFSKTKYNKNLTTDNSWEIIRGCPGSNNIVIGGVSKLFKYFVNNYNPDVIFSYCDFNKFNGKSYEELGMEFIGYTGPDMKWLLKNGKVVNRSPSHHSELKEAAIAQIFGAGSKKYIWRK